MAEIEMTVDSIRVSQLNYQRVVILKEKKTDRYLPIWIGPAEADSIAVKLQSVNVPRPLTHDLICNIANVAGLKIKSVIMNKLENDTHYAKLILTSRNKSYEIDCRPSDAINIAIRAGAPIFADEKVLEKAGIHLDPKQANP
jgi:bifunctional DNase/RNase